MSNIPHGRPPDQGDELPFVVSHELGHWAAQVTPFTRAILASQRCAGDTGSTQWISAITLEFAYLGVPKATTRQILNFWTQGGKVKSQIERVIHYAYNEVKYMAQVKTKISGYSEADLADLTMNAKAILAYFWRRHKNNEFSVSYNALLEDINLSKPTLRRALKELEDQLFLAVGRGGPQTGNAPSRYQVIDSETRHMERQAQGVSC